MIFTFLSSIVDPSSSSRIAAQVITGIGVFNYYYGDPNLGQNIAYIDPGVFKGYIQQALNGDVSGAATNIDKANNLGCPIDAFGRQI